MGKVKRGAGSTWPPDMAHVAADRASDENQAERAVIQRRPSRVQWGGVEVGRHRHRRWAPAVVAEIGNTIYEEVVGPAQVAGDVVVAPRMIGGRTRPAGSRRAPRPAAVASNGLLRVVVYLAHGRPPSGAVMPREGSSPAPTWSRISTYGAVERADGQRAVQREFHGCGARRLLACGRDLLGQVRGRGSAAYWPGVNVVVGQED